MSTQRLVSPAVVDATSEAPLLRAEALLQLHGLQEAAGRGDHVSLHAGLCQVRNSLARCVLVARPPQQRCPVRRLLAEIDEILAGEGPMNDGCRCFERVRSPRFRQLSSLGLNASRQAGPDRLDVWRESSQLLEVGRRQRR